MSLNNMINKLTGKTSGSPESAQTQAPSSSPSVQQSQEQKYNILPHPAKTNDPADLDSTSKQGGCFGGNAAWAAHNAAPGPYVPSQQQWSSVEQPKSRDELRARAAELNKRQ